MFLDFLVASIAIVALLSILLYFLRKRRSGGTIALPPDEEREIQTSAMAATPPDLIVVGYPTASYTEELAKGALRSVYGADAHIEQQVPASEEIARATRVLQWTAYDDTRHELTLARPRTVLASSYTIRKSLIRKHFLHRLVASHVVKHPEALLAPGKGTPQSWDAEISWADDLDAMWSDELYDLGHLLDENADKADADKRWFILKPGMADRGMGIRLFSSKDALQEIFESFEEGADDEEEDEDDTNVVANQLRHFVIQDYIQDPLLVDPRVVSINGSIPPGVLEPRKFHLRAYCIASGALTLYLSPHILALFSSKAYSPPSETEEVDLSVHLTNTALQKDTSTHFDAVRLLSELPLPIPHERILEQTRTLLAEMFAAALGGGAAHFQPVPNAFELFGADLLVRADGSVVLLELNAEPAVHLTGARLGWTLERMFEGVARACIVPFFDGERHGTDASAEEWKVGEEKYGLVKCLEVAVRGQGAW